MRPQEKLEQLMFQVAFMKRVLVLLSAVGSGSQAPYLRALTSTLQLGAALFNCQESRFFPSQCTRPPGPPCKLRSSKRTFLMNTTKGDGWDRHSLD